MTVMTKKTMMQIRRELIADADLRNWRYPQYRGHFDDYYLVRVLRNIKTKSGLAFVHDEIAIASPEQHDARFVTVWSRGNGIDTSIPRADVEVLMN